MNAQHVSHTNYLAVRERIIYLLTSLIILLAGALLGLETSVAQAATPIDAGYRDFKFNSGCNSTPTGEKPESKLWYNDGYWWGSLCDDATATYHIHRFNFTTQDWEDMGTVLDDRGGTKADILWDGANQKLYVASHVFTDIGSSSTSSSQWARLYRYSYNAGTKVYTLDGGFPVNVSRGQSETITLDKDSSGRLWVTYVESGKVMVNHSISSDTDWGTPYVLPVTGATSLSSDDISSLIAFSGRIALMWSNQSTKIMYMAFHVDSDANDQSWTSISVYNPGGSGADDHINLKSLQTDGQGSLFAVAKTSFSATGTLPLINLFACRTAPCTSASNWQIYPIYTVTEANTRAILLIDTDHRQLHVFSTDRGSGYGIFHKVTDMDNIQLANAPDLPFIRLNGDSKINNSTSTKQNVNSSTGLVVLASSQTSYQYYHNCLALGGAFSGCDTAGVPTTVAFASATYNVNENAGSISVTVNLNGTANQTVSVNYATSDGTATAGSDYAATSGTLTFNGVASQSFAIPITNDFLNEGNETINLTLSSPSGASLGTPSSAVLTISDDDPLPAVQFGQPTWNVDEDVVGGKLSANVNLSSSFAHTVTVDYTVTDGTATAGSDYTASNGTLTFKPGETSKNIDLTILDDTLYEEDETINLTLGQPVSATLGALTTGVVTVIDQDMPPTVQFAAATATVDEGGPAATVSVNLNTASGLTVTVDYATSDDTATAGTDYSAVGGTLTFAPGETEKNFQVAVANDSFDEPNETINLILSNPTNAGLGIPANASLTLLDDDGTPTARFATASVSVDESAGEATVVVNLVGATAVTTTVDYVTSDGTATADSDYTAKSGTLIFGPNLSGTATASFKVSILNDGLDEDEETIDLTLSNPTNGVVIGDPTGATVNIVDNDNAPLVQFKSANFSVAENISTGNAPVTITLNVVSGRPITVAYSASAGTATIGSDFTAVSDVVTLAPGEKSKTILVPIVNDNVNEGNETVNLLLNTATNATLGALKTSTLTIVDDDVASPIASVQWSAATFNTNESAGTATLTVQLSAPANALATVAYAVSADTASAGQDFIATDGVLTFAPGESSKTIVISVLDDAINEAPETLNVTLKNPSNAVIGSISTATLIIQDNDPQPKLVVGGNKIWADPVAGIFYLTLQLSAPSGQTVSVDYIISDKGGVVGTNGNNTLTLKPGEVSKTFAVPFAVNGGEATLTLVNPQNVDLNNPDLIEIIVIRGRSYLPTVWAP